MRWTMPALSRFLRRAGGRGRQKERMARMCHLSGANRAPITHFQPSSLEFVPFRAGASRRNVGKSAKSRVRW